MTCDVCGGHKGRPLTRGERDRLPDLAPSIEHLCDNCVRVRLNVALRESLVAADEERARRARRIR